jgi:cyclophilin family peptidyl-prolyl cis-trans isomerase
MVMHIRPSVFLVIFFSALPTLRAADNEKPSPPKVSPAVKEPISPSKPVLSDNNKKSTTTPKDSAADKKNATPAKESTIDKKPTAPLEVKSKPVADGSKLREFQRLHSEMNRTIAELERLRIRYLTADEEKRTELQSLWKEKIAEGTALEPKLIAAALAAYAEAPNENRPLVDFLLVVMQDKLQNDDYELAAEIGNLLMKHHCPSKSLPNMAGVAAFATSDFDAAEKYFAEAVQLKFYGPDRKDDKLAVQGAQMMGQIPYYKKIWHNEARLRDDETDANTLPRVLLKTTQGDIVLELFENQAPNTVANFISLVRAKKYDDRAFHRVVHGFMAPGGDPRDNGTGGPGYTISCECYFENHRNHFRGSLSMAHTGRRDSGGSQFFICFTPQQQLDGRHTVFGRVVKGMDVLAKLQRRDPSDPQAPRADKVIEATVLRARNHTYIPQKIELGAAP